MKSLLTVVLSLLFSINLAVAQYAKVSIPNSEVREITSAKVAGQTYELHVMLPAGYQNSTQSYPVLYLLDSQWDFPLLTSLYGQQYYDGFIPGLVIVGITWAGKPNAEGGLRARDFSPEAGASKFIEFMKSELFPFVESNYRVSNSNRTIAGCSLGGSFALYSLFKEPQLFQGYIAASPAYQGSVELYKKLEKENIKNGRAFPARVYITMGGAERGLAEFEKFSAHLKSGTNKQFSVETRILENTGHSGTKGEGFARGLQYVYARPNVKLSPAVLSKYTGQYKSERGELITLSAENGVPLMSYGGPNKIALRVASETEWYLHGEFLNIYFVKKNNEEGIELATYGRIQFLKKI